VPYPSQVNVDTILSKARAMLEAEGVEALSLGKLAAALNIKAPSLYRYFDSKNALLRALNGDTAARLVAAMRDAVDTQHDNKIVALALAYRAFALENPVIYRLAFGSASDELRPDEQTLEALALPLQSVMAQISGEEHSLTALRGVWALMHGYVSLELSKQMRRGGDLETGFVRAVEAYVRGWSL
jgi:AcrR family transcriptional regulator